MNKIPTVFRRDPENMKRVLPEVTPGCEWVLAGEGTPTRKYDGTCCMFDGERWWARREVKPGKAAPNDWQEVDSDEATGKRIGWELVERSGFAKWHAMVLADWPDAYWSVGTYELCGPKVQGNPERFERHVLRLHEAADALTIRPEELTFDGLRTVVVRLRDLSLIEGIVWHHPDGRMAKLKGRDFA